MRKVLKWWTLYWRDNKKDEEFCIEPGKYLWRNKDKLEFSKEESREIYAFLKQIFEKEGG